MKLSIVILNYNVRYFLELCLKSVKAATTHIDAEIIVVDNASKDDSCEMVKAQFPDVKLIENKVNLGFSKGNNIGVAQAKGEYLCILNPDTVVAEDTFDKLLAYSKTLTNPGAIACKLIDGAGNYLPESKRNIPYVRAALKKLMGNATYYYANHLEANQVGAIDVLVGAFMFLKRSVYNEVKGFDEDYFMYGEDIDLSYKIVKAGYKNYYLGTTSVIHFKGESTLRDKNYAKRFYGAMQIFYKKHFRKNIAFDCMVWLGIRSVYLLRNAPVEKIKYVFQYVLISDKAHQALTAVLPKIVIVRKEISNFANETEIILDANHLSYKEIIAFMSTYGNTKKWTYKILPRQSKFIIGSDNAINRGEIIEF